MWKPLKTKISTERQVEDKVPMITIREVKADTNVSNISGKKYRRTPTGTGRPKSIIRLVSRHKEAKTSDKSV